MSERRLFTIGVYGRDGGQFAEALADYTIDTLIDIRARRGVRGSEYAWANSNRLQAGLATMGINYRHLPELAPSQEVRDLQRQADRTASVGKRERSVLAPAFRDAYTREVLDRLDRSSVTARIYEVGVRPVLLCVERDAFACHRSLVSEWLSVDESFDVTHL
jgi:uncharacterized protein (DUF488 family)